VFVLEESHCTHSTHGFSITHGVKVGCIKVGCFIFVQFCSWNISTILSLIHRCQTRSGWSSCGRTTLGELINNFEHTMWLKRKASAVDSRRVCLAHPV